jgi:hypothetical protein
MKNQASVTLVMVRVTMVAPSQLHFYACPNPSNSDLFFHTKLKKLDVIHKGLYLIDKLSIPLFLQQNPQAQSYKPPFSSLH